MESDIRELAVFYFSGTGNARAVASWFCSLAKERDIPCRVSDIARTVRPPENIAPETVIGIISPIHGFNYPKITLDFIRRFPRGKNRVVLMNTRAGMRIGGWVTPGLTGVAFMLSSLILRSKGYKIIGQIPFDMPSNWISLHPALRSKTVDIIVEKNRFRVKKHFERLFSRGKDLAARKEIVQDVLISPVALGYYFIGRYFIAKSFYASSACTNCNLCMEQCPVQAIEKVDARPYWTFKCESCMKCMNNCPVRAIETAHGLCVAVIWSASAVCSFVFYDLLPAAVRCRTVKFLLWGMILVALAALFYRAQQFMLRSRSLARPIEFISLTRYKFWGRYKFTGGSDIRRSGRR